MGRRLLDGAYRCLVTARDLAGHTSQREGQLLVQADAFSLLPSDPAAAIQSASADRGRQLTPVGEADGSATTLLSHDGTDGRLTAGRGALSLRTGNFFAGTDAERMRITAAGDVGIGVGQPGAKLDVAGLIRTSEGIVFPDGTIQTTAAGPGGARGRLSSGRSVQAGSDQQGKAGTGIPGPNQVNLITAGTADRIAKFAADGTTLVNSSVTESPAGDIGIGTASPGGVFDLQRSSSGDILQRLWNTGGGGAKLRYVAATGATSQLQLTDGLEWLSAIAGNNSTGLQFRVRDSGTPNSEAQLNASARMTITRNGNVGVGTTSPGSLLTLRASTTTAPALEINQGAIKVKGAGVGTNTLAFIHQATAANIAAAPCGSSQCTLIDHPLINDDPNAILIVTPNYTPPGVAGYVYNNHPIGVCFCGTHWVIFNQDTAAMPVNAAFNVLVVKSGQ